MLFDVLAAHLSFDGETRGNLRYYGPLVSVSFYLYLFLFSHFKIRLLYMKNVMLRATRTFIEDLCAPEYAHNHLAVEVSHPDGLLMLRNSLSGYIPANTACWAVTPVH